jgi:hypothetical protein
MAAPRNTHIPQGARSFTAKDLHADPALMQQLFAAMRAVEPPPKPPEPVSVSEWMCEMFWWGQAVRRDILRLEAAAKLSKGDPGSPPLPPPPLDDDLLD